MIMQVTMKPKNTPTVASKMDTEKSKSSTNQQRELLKLNTQAASYTSQSVDDNEEWYKIIHRMWNGKSTARDIELINSRLVGHNHSTINQG